MKITVAGLNIEIQNRYDHIVGLAKDYLTDSDKVDMTVFATEEELDLEAEKSSAEHGRAYLESIVVYRKIAEQLPSFDAYVLHGAVLAMDGAAYVITARSGVGKTTHIRLWRRAFGESVHVLNGDKPIIRFIDGVPYACGTPWRGKENYGVPEMLPLRGIGFLERSEKSRAEAATVADSTIRLVSQMYIPKDRMNALRALGLADKTLKRVRLVNIFADMSEEAARASQKALTE